MVTSFRHDHRVQTSRQCVNGPLDRDPGLIPSGDWTKHVQKQFQNRWGLAGHHRRDGRAESAEQIVPVPLLRRFWNCF
jgi:hypothetical protein